MALCNRILHPAKALVARALVTSSSNSSREMKASTALLKSEAALSVNFAMKHRSLEATVTVNSNQQPLVSEPQKE
jgi:hypothetical protein